MSRKLMTSAFALTAVLAFSGLTVASASANPWGGGPDIDDSFNDNSKTDDSYNDNSKTDVDVDVDVKDSLNNNSTNDSNNDNREYKSDVDVDDSFNDNSKTEDSNNDNREYKTDVDIDDSFNSKIDDSYNSDSSMNDSNNDNSNHSTWRISLSVQDLDANVSGFDFDVGGSHHKAGKLETGDISNSGGAFAGFAGIQTANYNTGFAANNQAATAISANANVSFGGSGGGD